MKYYYMTVGVRTGSHEYTLFYPETTTLSLIEWVKDAQECERETRRIIYREEITKQEYEELNKVL